MHPLALSEVARNLCYGMGGVGTLKLVWKSSEQTGRIPAALEGAAVASEDSAQMVRVLQDMHATQIETENTPKVMAMETGDVKSALKGQGRGDGHVTE